MWIEKQQHATEGHYSWWSGERVGGVRKNDCISSKVQPWRKNGSPPEERSLLQAGFWLPVPVILNNELILMAAGWLPTLPSPLLSPPYTYTLLLRVRPPLSAAAAPDSLACNNPQPHVPRLSASQDNSSPAVSPALLGSAAFGGGWG